MSAILRMWKESVLFQVFVFAKTGGVFSIPGSPHLALLRHDVKYI